MYFVRLGRGEWHTSTYCCINNLVFRRVNSTNVWSTVKKKGCTNQCGPVMPNALVGLAPHCFKSGLTRYKEQLIT